MPRGKIILTFDVEEFDIPLEYGHSIPFEEQIEITTTGLHKIHGLLSKHQIRCTFFTTAAYAQRQPALIKTISERHEIASHGCSHSSFSVGDLLSSKEILEAIINKPLYGFRMARFAPVDNSEIKKAGYAYNSSSNPTWIPGRYNYLSQPRLPFFSANLLNIPASVTPFFRIPLFWLSFKNFPMWLFKSFMLRTLKHDGFLSLYFHPWEFIEINAYGLPWFINRMSGKVMLERLDYTINLLKSKADFITMYDFYKLPLQPGLLKEQHEWPL
jgi:Polysaccharide deacetylase